MDGSEGAFSNPNTGNVEFSIVRNLCLEVIEVSVLVLVVAAQLGTEGQLWLSTELALQTAVTALAMHSCCNTLSSSTFQRRFFAVHGLLS